MTARVPFVDLARIHGPLRGQFERAFRAISERGDFILGDEVGRFEDEFAAYVGTKFAVGVNSGTAALAIAIKAAGIDQGDEVIVPAHTYVASALGVRHAGAVPVFCDVDPITGLIDVRSASEVVGPRTAAVLPVHLYGQACAMDDILRFAERSGLAVIEDAAQAHGAAWDGTKAGAFGTAAAFSFYPSKNLGAFGDGGIVCTSDIAIAESARRLRNLGQLVKGDHEVEGFNERLDTLQAAILRVKLPHLDEWNEDRRRSAATYRARLPEEVTLIPDRERGLDVHHLFPVRIRERDQIAGDLAARGVDTGIHYSPAAHRQPPFAGDPERTSMENANAWAAESLSLPMFAGLTESEIDTVCAVVTDCASAAGALGARDSLV